MNISEITTTTETETTPSIKEMIQQFVLKSSEWGRYLLSKWIIILVAIIIGGLLGYYSERDKKITYVAKITYVTEGAKSGGSDFGGLASFFGAGDGGGSGGADAFSGDNLFELMQSRSMIQKALLTEVEVKGKKQSLAEFYIDFNELRKKWKGNPSLMNIRFLPGANPDDFSIEQNSLMGEFHGVLIKSNHLSSAKQKNSSFTTINVISENELFAKLFCEALIKVVSDFYVQTKTKKAMNNFRILQHQVDSMRVVMNEAISGVAMHTDENPNPNPSRQILRVPTQRRQVDVQATQSLFVQMTQNLENSKISLRKETPLLEIIDKPVFPLPAGELNIKGAIIFGILVGAIIVIALIVVRRLYMQVMKA